MHEARKLYPRLAASALKKNLRIYLPYLLACTGTVLMFNLLLSLSLDKAIANMRGGGTVQPVLMLGSIVVAILSVILLFYTNGVIIRNRKREFALYNILGMEKRHVGIVLLWETLMTALISICLGLLGSFIFSKLAQMMIARMLDGKVSLALQFQPLAAGLTLALFMFIFLMTLIKNLAVIFKSRPVELLSSANVGEREPKSRHILAILGVLTLGGGYALALYVKDAVSAILLFFVAVILVIIGTYLLFTSFSIVLLKALRRSKRYYYKTNHFISLSGMLYRMKRNAAGLAGICVLSTMVLVTVSTTFSLYIGLDEIMDTRYPTEVSFSQDAQNYTLQERDARRQSIFESAEQMDLKVIDERHYPMLNFFAPLSKDGETLLFERNSDYSTLLNVSFMTIEDYERATGEKLTLSEGEALYTGSKLVKPETLNIGDISLKMQPYPDYKLSNRFAMITTGEKMFVLVANDDVLNAICEIQQLGYGEKAASIITEEVSFNLEGDKEDILRFEEMVHGMVVQDHYHEITSISARSLDFYLDYGSLYGGLFFLGLFLGLLFVMSCVTIMYYKQLSEGVDDCGRYEIMQKVGLTKGEARSAIRSQILTVFFLPLVTAGVHVAFAFPMVTYIMNALGLANIELFAKCTLLSFAAFSLLYTFVYLMTARAYYRIVEHRGN